MILMIEDEPQIRFFLHTTLQSHGYRIEEAATAREGLAKAAALLPELILLDLGLPDRDGLDVTRQLRTWTSVPIIILSARGQEQDKVAALDLGADDYLTKPFGTEELLARIRVALRHAAQSTQEEGNIEFKSGNLLVNLVARQVYVEDKLIHLTPNEYSLLTSLIRCAGKVVTQQQLLKQVWGQAYAKESHYLRVYMSQLRHKIEHDPARPQHILTEPGIGYRINIVE